MTQLPLSPGARRACRCHVMAHHASLYAVIVQTYPDINLSAVQIIYLTLLQPLYEEAAELRHARVCT